MSYSTDQLFDDLFKGAKSFEDLLAKIGPISDLRTQQRFFGCLFEMAIAAECGDKISAIKCFLEAYEEYGEFYLLLYNFQEKLSIGELPKGCTLVERRPTDE